MNAEQKKSCILIMTSSQYWARGKNLADALASVRKMGAKKTDLAGACIVHGDDSAKITGMGDIEYTQGATVEWKWKNSTVEKLARLQ